MSFVQALTTLFCLVPLIRFQKIQKVSVTKHVSLVRTAQSLVHFQVLKWTILPLSFGKFFATVSSHFSISKGKNVSTTASLKNSVAVSYAHTIKASMPIWVLLLGRCIWGERQPPKIYCSVIPIFIGIGMATISEINFNLIGTLSAFVSTIGFALQARFSNFHFLRIFEIDF